MTRHPPVPEPATAQDIMRRDVFTLSPDTPLDQAMHELLRRRFSGAPVVDVRGRLQGVISERDGIGVLAAAVFHVLPEGTVGEHMTRNVETVAPRTDLFRLIWLFHERPYRRLFVTDEDGTLRGMIARRDILAVLEKAWLRRARARGRGPTTQQILEERRS